MKKKVVKLVAGNWITLFLNIILNIFIARFLGPDGKGKLTLVITSTQLISSFMTFGLAHAAAYYFIIVPGFAKKIVILLIYICSVGALFLSVVIFYLHDILTEFLIGYYTPSFFINSFFVSYTILLINSSVIGNSLIALKDTKTYLFSTTFAIVITMLLVIIGFLLFGPSLEITLISYFIGQVFTVFVMYKKIFSLKDFSIHTNLSYGEIVKFGLSSYLGSVSSFFIKRVDLYLISYFFPTPIDEPKIFVILE